MTVARLRPKPPARRAQPTVALALGGGGARGLAHIVVLEALEELAIRPVLVAGCSMGAIIGASWCAGVSARRLREHALTTFRDRAGVMTQLMMARSMGFAEALRQGIANPVMVDAPPLLQSLLPQALPARFEDLPIPLAVLAADFHALSRQVFTKGPLGPAVAASMAVPGLVKPVLIDGRVYVDGGAVDPLPVEEIAGKADVCIAVDVSGAVPAPGEARIPTPFEAIMGAFSLSQWALTDARLKAFEGQFALVRPPVQAFRLLDYFEAKAILAAAAPVKDEVKRMLSA